MDSAQNESAKTEPDVHWPKVHEPVIVTRDLRLLTTVKYANPFPLTGVKLEVLVNGCLYIVVEDGYHDIVRRGNILSRNLKETKKHGGSFEDEASHCFVQYDGINAARRGIGRIDTKYKKVETPHLSEWRKQLEKMLRLSWTLHKIEGKENEFEWVSETAIKKNRGVIDEKKVEALDRTRKAATRKDKKDRRNTGMIPLLCGAADDRLFARIQAIRGIGRKMDWRSVVLENYIDQMRSKCIEIERDMEHKLSADTLFGASRTTKKVAKSAYDMRVYATHLRSLNARPFTRSLTHAAFDLESAAALMEQAAQTADPAKMEEVKLILRRIYRSMRLIEYHSRLEEILLIVAEARHRKMTVQGDQLVLCLNEMSQVQKEFACHDPFTKESLEYGFKRSILPNVRHSLGIALLTLSRQSQDSSNQLHTKTAYEYLKMACAPF